MTGKFWDLAAKSGIKRPSDLEEWAVHPGELLRDELEARGMSQADLARATGLTQKHISYIVNARAGIGTDAAYALESALGISARTWVRLQADYDVTHHKRRGR